MEKILSNEQVGHLLLIGENKTNDITNMTKEQVEDLTSVKAKVLGELNKAGFPDLEFLFSPEVLDEAISIFDELLDNDITEFRNLIKRDPSELAFSDLESEMLSGDFYALISHFDSVKSSEKTEKIMEHFQKRYTEYSNEMRYSKEYYNIYKFLFENGNLDLEQSRIAQKQIENFELGGINLETEIQEKVKGINLRLVELSKKFSTNVTKSKKEFSYYIDNFEIISDLPEDTLESAKKRAEKEGKEGYLFDADPTSYSDILDYCSDSKVREDFLKARLQFASNGEYDNRPLILETLKLKEEKAKLLAYNNHAELSLARKMADSPEQIFSLIGGIKDKAKEKSKKEMQMLCDYVGVEKLESWDIGYYERKLKEEKYDIDEKEIKKYLKYENVLDYLFSHVKNFYGLELKEIETSVYDSDVKVYEVYKNGNLISYYMADFFYNPDKKGGAWANNLREKNHINGKIKLPLVINVCNYQKSESGEILLTKDDTETLFHEFGHAMHEILSESKYSNLSGFHVEWDFVELPSQINENWVTEKECFYNLSSHYQTGEKIDRDILEKMEELKTLFSGMYTMGQNVYALMDMHLHTITPPETVEELDKIVLDLVNSIVLNPKGPEYKMHASFSHIFAGGYSAGYYSYMWAELLEADVFARIKEMGMFDREVGEKFISTILGQGTRKPAAELFRDFMGRDLDNTAFMKRKGLL